MNNQFNPQQKEAEKKTKTSRKKSKRKSKDAKVGEYVDYEEID